jgi:signal transduction histidine kinase
MAKSKILIVDDEEQTRFCMSLSLQMNGYDAITASNGEDALETIIEMQHSKKPVDLIITDIDMPKLNGEELIKKLNDLNIRIPSIIITGLGEKDLVVRLMRLGCRDFIDKPFDPDDIEKRIRHILDENMESTLEKERTEHFALIGEKTRSVVHDLNNILCSTIGYADVARCSINKNDPVYNKIQKIYSSAHYAAEICKNIMELKSKDSKPLKLKTEIRAIVERIAEILRTVAPPDIRISVQTPERPVWLRADAELLQQAILNLGINAINAIKDTGEIKIKIFSEEISQSPGVKAKSSTGISVSDTGCGISDENLQKLFRESFSTKPGGHGLGLMTVKKIIDNHNGCITVKSGINKGTEFKILIPNGI